MKGQKNPVTTDVASWLSPISFLHDVTSSVSRLFMHFLCSCLHTSCRTQPFCRALRGKLSCYLFSEILISINSILTSGYPRPSARRKRVEKKILVLTLGSPSDLDFRTWTSRPGFQDLGLRTWVSGLRQTHATHPTVVSSFSRHFSLRSFHPFPVIFLYGRFILFPSFFSVSTVTFLFPVM